MMSSHIKTLKKICKQTGSFEEYVKELALNWFIPGLLNSHRKESVYEFEGTSSYAQLPMERKWKVKEIKYFRECALGKR